MLVLLVPIRWLLDAAGGLQCCACQSMLGCILLRVRHLQLKVMMAAHGIVCASQMASIFCLYLVLMLHGCAASGSRYGSPPRGFSPVRSMGKSPPRVAFERGPSRGGGLPGRGQSRLGPPGGGRHERTVWVGQVVSSSFAVCFGLSTMYV